MGGSSAISIGSCLSCPNVAITVSRLAVLLNRKPSPVETYNDLDGEVVNFFQVLRDQPDELVRVIALTPFARKELEIACGEVTEDLSALERARRFYVRALQTRTGFAQTASPGRWAHCVQTSRAGMAGAVSRWFGGIEDLFYIADRLMRVQIENAPAHLEQPIVEDLEIQKRVEYVCRNLQNRAGVRLLLACLLAKIHYDIRKPHTEIGTQDCYSGRTYDEIYISRFIRDYDLPCNPTTAFLTPALFASGFPGCLSGNPAHGAR